MQTHPNSLCSAQLHDCWVGLDFALSVLCSRDRAKATQKQFLSRSSSNPEHAPLVLRLCWLTWEMIWGPAPAPQTPSSQTQSYCFMLLSNRKALSPKAEEKYFLRKEK